MYESITSMFECSFVSQCNLDLVNWNLVMRCRLIHLNHLSDIGYIILTTNSKWGGSNHLYYHAIFELRLKKDEKINKLCVFEFVFIKRSDKGNIK